MKTEYDFSGGRKNPYFKSLKKQVPVDIDYEIVEYFKSQSKSTGVSYQALINLYLAKHINNPISQ
jgi:uncharacterized protein (DUF4415 family)